MGIPYGFWPILLGAQERFRCSFLASNAFLDSAVVHACEERWEETLQLLQRAELPDIVMQLGKKMGLPSGELR